MKTTGFALLRTCDEFSAQIEKKIKPKQDILRGKPLQ